MQRIVTQIIRDFPGSRTGQWSINSTVPLVRFTTPGPAYESWLNSSKRPSERKSVIRQPTFACDTWHDVVTPATAAIFCCFDDRLTTTPNESRPVALGGCQLNSIDVDQRLAATFIDQRLAGDATII